MIIDTPNRINQLFYKVLKSIMHYALRLKLRIKNKIKIKISKTIDSKLPFINNEFKKKFENDVLYKISQCVYIISPIQTLEGISKIIIEQKKGAYMRFGDGDAFLSVGLNDMLQKSNQNLSIEMQEAFALKGDGIFKSLSIHSKKYGYEIEMYEGNHMVSEQLADRLLSYTYPYFVGHKIYSPICLHYAATYYPKIANDFLRLIKRYCICFVGNETTPTDVVNRLFGIVTHIKTPSKNAYDQIDRIENETCFILEKTNNFRIVVVAMGCSGRPFMKRIYQKGFNVFLFDFGSLLDGICGYKTRTWLRKENIDYELVLNNL